MKDKPDGFIIAWDAPQATKRKEHFSGYKANRKKTPDDLKRQIRETKELIDKLGIPAIQVPGYEADDIMATVAKSIGKDDHHVTIVSSDKDLKQLLSENISCLDTMKGMRTTAQSRVETE